MVNAWQLPILATFMSSVTATINTGCVGHRGYSSKYPENTILAMNEAIYAGAQGIEADLAVSSDLIVFVMHDSSLTRTTNCTGSTKDGIYTVPYYGYIDSCDAGEGEKVPLLEDILEIAMANPTIKVYLDIKNGLPVDIMDLMVPVFDSYDYDFTHQVFLAPWSTAMVNRAKEVNPRMPRCWIGSTTSNVIEEDVQAYNLAFSSLKSNSSFVDAVQAEGREVYGWTINTDSALKEAFDMELDAALTDYITTCVEIRSEICPGNSLQDCVDTCPPSPPASYDSCIIDCGDRC